MSPKAFAKWSSTEPAKISGWTGSFLAFISDHVLPPRALAKWSSTDPVTETSVFALTAVVGEAAGGEVGVVATGVMATGVVTMGDVPIIGDAVDVGNDDVGVDGECDRGEGVGDAERYSG